MAADTNADANKDVPPAPMPSDKGRWRVAAAPDGRGMPGGIVLGPEDGERTANNESGHALVGMLTPEADPVRQVSIIPRGLALGVTLSTPDADRVSYSREDLEAKIKVSLDGRVAEEVVYNKITTGAESDLQQLTQIARQMVGRWGMSDKFGPRTHLPSDGQGPLLPGAAETSPQTQWLIDEEVQRIVDEAYAEVTTCSRSTASGSTASRARCSKPRPSTRRMRMPQQAFRCAQPNLKPRSANAARLSASTPHVGIRRSAQSRRANA
jgi:hypothetical protein